MPKPKVARNWNGQVGASRNLSGMMLRAQSGGIDPVQFVRANSPLPADAQQLIDDVLVRDALTSLVIVRDLMEEGLVYPLDNWFGVTELYWEAGNEVGTPVRSMSPVTRRENYKADRTGYRLPIPCTSMEFAIEPRELAASQRAGAPLDTANVEQGMRRLNEANEDAVLNGMSEIKSLGNTVPGILNAPNAHGHTYTGGELLTAKSGEEIVAEVGIMLGLMDEDDQPGPYNWYVPKADHRYLATTDYKANSSDTILSRLQAIESGGGRNLRVRMAGKMPATKSAMIQMTNDVIQLVVGQEPEHLSWEEGPFDIRHVLLSCIVPRVRTNYSNQSGIVIGSTT